MTNINITTHESNSGNIFMPHRAIINLQTLEDFPEDYNKVIGFSTLYARTSQFIGLLIQENETILELIADIAGTYQVTIVMNYI